MILLLLVGRLVPEKGVRDAVRVLADVRARCPAQLMIVGTGPEAGPAQAGTTPARRPVARGHPRTMSYAQPQSSTSMREQITWEYDNVALRSDTHERNSRRWSTATSSITVVVTLTSGISALSIGALKALSSRA